jgi:hypothetical protein
VSRLPLLRRIIIDGHALRDICDEATVNELEVYIEKHVPHRPTVEIAYGQKKVDEESKAIEDFWKERGISVGVRTTLTQIPNSPRYAALKFEVYKR